MLRTYLLRRSLAMIPMFFLMTGVFFALQNYLPGGPVQEMLAQIRGAGEGGGGRSREFSAQDIDRVRKELEHQYGLDRPVAERYLIWVKNVLTLNFGNSITTRRPAIDQVIERLPVSLGFGLPGFLLTYLVCIPLGIFMALRDGSAFDTAASVFLFIAYSVPALVVAVLLLLVLCTDRVLPHGALFPLGGLRSDNYDEMTSLARVLDYLRHMALPILASLIGGFTLNAMLMKGSLLEVIRADFVRTARAKGLSERTVVFKHALRNAVLPLLVNASGFLSAFIAGSIVIEQVFGLPGVGTLMLDSLSSRDFNVLMCVIVLQSLAIMFGQLLVDLSYVIVDPRIDFK